MWCEHRIRGARTRRKPGEGGEAADQPPAGRWGRRIRGGVIRRSPPTRQHPPPSDVLCGPAAELPLLVLTIQAPAADAGWKRCKVWLWGLWCDRLAEPVRRGDTVTIVNATVRT